MQTAVFRVAATFCALVSAAATAHAQKNPFGYLIDAANQISSIRYSHAVTSPEDNARIAKVACDALTRLSKDPALMDTLHNVAEMGKDPGQPKR